MYGPVMKGKLVRLRPPKPEDASVMITWFEDMEVTRFIELRHPPSIESEKEWLEKVAKDPNHIQWVIEFKSAPVGTTAIVEIDWKNGFGTTGTIIGDKSVWGKGLGGEMMKLRTEYAFTQLPLRKLKSAYLDGNEASGRAQAAAGYREIGRWHGDRFVGGRWLDLVLTEVMRDDWAKGQVKAKAKRKRS
jgi:RimJ/RimL family protein N-acetyltransferase